MIGDHPFGMMGWPSFRNDGGLFGMTVPSSSFRNQGGDLPLIITKITVIFLVINKGKKWGIRKRENHLIIIPKFYHSEE